MDAASIGDEEDLESVLEEQRSKDDETEYVKTSVYDKPIKAVALMDTGSCATVVKPHVLPKEMWAPFSKKFAAANSEVFTINLISKKPVGLEIFAGQTTWLRVLGRYLPDKDVLFGFDAFFRTHGLHIKPTGLSYKGQFLPFTGIQSILKIQEAPEEEDPTITPQCLL
ncbi:hypothetical protein Ahy_B04g070883 isoform A [Arachis hypogaea]|uniref:Retropepsins domain-containing protein n=1 Tax=Arachis hypogaea TaxID=3818 RepID=A0A444ZJP1_ARAHY|nr:hypothetical protein Ahy_B04g070883 isoform A [Arachis hypogaea]